MAQAHQPTTYTGPSVKEMIDHHDMAECIMQYHDPATGQNQILDDHELAMLRQFVSDPEQQRGAVLKEAGVEQSPDETSYSGSLVGYIALRHGHRDVLGGDEIAKLREWFGEQ